MVKVKICGIARIEDAEAAVRAGADFIGIVSGIPRSPRNVSLERAAEIVSDLEDAQIIIVTQVPTFRQLENLVSAVRPSGLQVYHDVDVEALKSLFPDLYMIRAFNALDPDAHRHVTNTGNRYDAVLLDSLRDGLGGSGVAHDWNGARLIRDEVFPRPLFLSGGLNSSNVRSAIERVHPYGVDVSSGVESRPGVKDPSKIAEFVRSVRD